MATLSALLESDCRRTVRVGPFLGINKLATPASSLLPPSTFGRVSKLANSRISATTTTATASFGSVGGGSCKTARRNDRRTAAIIVIKTGHRTDAAPSAFQGGNDATAMAQLIQI